MLYSLFVCMGMLRVYNLMCYGLRKLMCITYICIIGYRVYSVNIPVVGAVCNGSLYMKVTSTGNIIGGSIKHCWVPEVSFCRREAPSAVVPLKRMKSCSTNIIITKL